MFVIFKETVAFHCFYDFMKLLTMQNVYISIQRIGVRIKVFKKIYLLIICKKKIKIYFVSVTNVKNYYFFG